VNRVCAIMGDTKGPEIRTGLLKNREVELIAGRKFLFTTDKTIVGDETMVSVTYEDLPKDIKEKDLIFVDDGTLIFEVETVQDKFIYTTVMFNGVLGENKGLIVPGIKTSLPAISEVDLRDIEFCCENEVDFIALSHVRSPQDVITVRNLQCVKDKGLKLIAKIDSNHGIENFKDILDVADGIMIPRGELGTNINIETIAIVQKKMIKECNILGKPVIAESQMLESMVRNPRPTRAEVSDVANAIFDGVDCVTLSSETARGKYPIDSVIVMRRICKETEKVLSYRNIYTSLRELEHQMKEWSQPSTITDSIASSAVKTCWDLKGSLIISVTSSGKTALRVAKYRPHTPILCISTDPKITRQCILGRGIIPVLTHTSSNLEQIAFGIQWAKEKGLLKQGEIVVITQGMVEGTTGSTNMIKVERVE